MKLALCRMLPGAKASGKVCVRLSGASAPSLSPLCYHRRNIAEESTVSHSCMQHALVRPKSALAPCDRALRCSPPSVHLRGAASLLALCFINGCGGGRLTTRYVDTPAGSVVKYGAPQDKSYSVEAQPEHDVLRLYIYEQARCPKIPVELVDRREDKLRGDEVVESTNMGKVQIAKDPQGMVPCNAGYARDVQVSLVLGTSVYALGTTNSEGYVGVNLASYLDRGLRNEALPDQAQVRIRPPYGGAPQDVGSVPLSELKRHDAEVQGLLDELSAILEKGSAASSQEIARSYVLYEQLRKLSFYDPRFKGLAARFWELLYGRKQDEATERLGKNLKALDEAREVLRTAGLAAFPVYVQAAINSGAVDSRAMEWAHWQLLGALRTNSIVCDQGFHWDRITSYGFPPTVLAGLYYLNFARGPSFSGSIPGLCQHLHRW